MKIGFTILLLSMTLFACNEVQKNKNDKKGKEPLLQTLTEPQQIVEDYLKWYFKSQMRLDSINVFKMIPKGDTASFYAIDFNGVARYLNEFKKSGFVTDKYIAPFISHFKYCDSIFQKTHQKDGPPEGFEVDLVSGWMDDSDVSENIDKAVFENTQQTNSKCKMTVIFPSRQYNFKYHAALSKCKGQWLIDELYRAD